MLIICCLYCIYISLKLDVVFILENKMFVMSSKLYHIKKKISLFYFTYVEIYPMEQVLILLFWIEMKGVWEIAL